MDSRPLEHISLEQLLERLIVSRSTETTDSLDIVTLEEFAERMKVGETTVWKWIRTGHLKAGRHYIQFDRVIRFHWCRDLIDRLHEDCCTEQSVDEASQAENIEAPGVKRKRQSYGKHINFDI